MSRPSFEVPAVTTHRYKDVEVVEFQKKRVPHMDRAYIIALERCEPFFIPWMKFCLANQVDMVRTMMVSCYLQGFSDATSPTKVEP